MTNREINTVTEAMTVTHTDDSQQSMEEFENQIAEYLLSDKTHFVRYRVTPIYRNIERVARGVEIEAQSVSSNDIHFNVYLFNAQPDWQINYYTGMAMQSN